MKLYSAALSLFGKKIEIALGEKGLAYERVMVAFSQTEGYAPRHPDVVAANPKRQVPVLIDDDFTVYDSTVILEYLEDAYPEPPLYPQGAKERARCRQLELYADEVVVAPLRALMHRTEPWEDEARRSELEIEATKAEAALAEQFAWLDSELGDRPYFGGAFSVADIALFTTIHYSERLGGPSLVETARLHRWYRSLAERPVFARVVEEIAAADRKLSRAVGGASAR